MHDTPLLGLVGWFDVLPFGGWVMGEWGLVWCGWDFGSEGGSCSTLWFAAVWDTGGDGFMLLQVMDDS